MRSCLSTISMGINEYHYNPSICLLQDMSTFNGLIISGEMPQLFCRGKPLQVFSTK